MKMVGSNSLEGRAQEGVGGTATSCAAKDCDLAAGVAPNWPTAEGEREDAACSGCVRSERAERQARHGGGQTVHEIGKGLVGEGASQATIRMQRQSPLSRN